MKRRWAVYISIILLLGISIRGYAASMHSDVETMATNLAADYSVLAGSVPPDMTAGDIIIEARLPIGGVDDGILRPILESLPTVADTTAVSDYCRDTRWLHITCTSGADSVYRTAFDMLAALEPISLHHVQLSLNVRWETGTVFSATEKKDILHTLFGNIDARTVASMADERIVSVSGYSPLLTLCAGAGEDAMNITASLCTTPAREGSTLWLGTPVLTVEY